jgi:hypothetical protein
MQAKDGRKIFHARMHVTRIEEWFVEADTAEEAKRMLETGQGERAHLGDCVQVEFTDITE